MTDLDPRERHRRAALRYVLLLLVGLCPLVAAWGVYAGIEPINPIGFWRLWAGSWILTFALYGLSSFIIDDADARALWLGGVLLPFGMYRLAVAALGSLGLHLVSTSPVVAIAYALAAATVLTSMVRPWRRTRRDLVPLTLIAVALVGTNAYHGAARFWQNPATRWRPAIDQIVGAATATHGPHHSDSRDIYYIVLDGFGRGDTLRDMYDVDLHDLVDFLHARGFYVADQARSNYAHTMLSFSSFMNLGYLDPLVPALGSGNASWLPLVDLIQQNALMRLAKDAGYETVAIGSDFQPTRQIPEADLCFCGLHGLTLFEQLVVNQTPFAALPLEPWTYGTHRRVILDGFSALEHLPPASMRRFVFAHIVAPHPPFVLGIDGASRTPDRAFTIGDGDDFRGSREEYVRGYHDQALFVATRLRGVIDAIVSRPGPRPVIVVHGDHGPGAMLRQNDLAGTNLPERMDIFAAYYVPDAQDRLYPSITPVNAARVLANAYFATDLPRLPDVSWFSTAERPYDFTAVPAESRATVVARP